MTRAGDDRYDGSHDGDLERDESAAELRDGDDVARLVERQWGDPLRRTGVVHGTSIWKRDANTHVSIRLGPQAPTAIHDTVALGVARARADAILTTGRNLRSEPELTHALPGSPSIAAALADWRRRHLGKTAPPVSLVLTSGQAIDFEHPFFAGPGRKVLFTDQHGAYRMESRAADAGAEVVVDSAPSPEGAVDFLRAAFGAATICLEAGPSVSRRLYGDAETAPVIDEVMLSIFDGEHLPTAARGARQPTADELARLFPKISRPYRVASADGPWSFQCYGR